MKRISLSVAVLAVLFVLPIAAEDGDDAELSKDLEKAKEKVTTERHLLRYKFKKDEVIRWNVVHLGTMETTISGNTVTTKSRSASTKAWRVTDVDAKGNITLTHTIEDVDMWQKLSDTPEIRYNSKTDKTPPDRYVETAKTIGKPLTTVRITTQGEILERWSDRPNPNFGVGGIVMLLPPKPAKVGGTWYEPQELRVPLPDRQVKKIKIRKFYTLKKVAHGVATISVETQVLTPINSARVQAQLMQQLTNGTIKFDLDAGRIIGRQVDWDETVVGFNGADSLMKYLARFTEELSDNQQAAKPDDQDGERVSARKKRTDEPALRR